MRDPAERFWERVRKDESGCWLWCGAPTIGTGYGKFWVHGTKFLVHRWSYEHFVGPIPEGLQIDHLCRVRMCVNPEHMEPVTAGENARRGAGWAGNLGQAGKQRARTHCYLGHPFSGENLYITPAGVRRCRACDRRRGSAYRRRLGMKPRYPEQEAA